MASRRVTLSLELNQLKVDTTYYNKTKITTKNNALTNCEMNTII